MRIEVEKYRVLTANEGVVLTNGETFGKTVVLPLNADASVWEEVSEAEAQEIITRMEAEDDV